MKTHRFISFGALLLSVLAITSCEKYWWQSRTKEINFKIDGIELQAHREFNLVQPSQSVYYYLKFVEENLFELDMQCITPKGTSRRVCWIVDHYGGFDSEVLNRFKLTYNGQFKNVYD